MADGERMDLDEWLAWSPPLEPDFRVAYRPVGFRYRAGDAEPWSFAPLSDSGSMETMKGAGWQVEKLYRRVVET